MTPEAVEKAPERPVSFADRRYLRAFEVVQVYPVQLGTIRNARLRGTLKTYTMRDADITSYKVVELDAWVEGKRRPGRPRKGA